MEIGFISDVEIILHIVVVLVSSPSEWGNYIRGGSRPLDGTFFLGYEFDVECWLYI